MWAALLSSDNWIAGISPVKWMASDPNVALLREAASVAAEGLKAGDYANRALYGALGELIAIYERFAEKPCSVGRITSDKSVSELTRLFFEQVDPDLPWQTIWSGLDGEARARRRAKTT